MQLVHSEYRRNIAPFWKEPPTPPSPSKISIIEPEKSDRILHFRLTNLGELTILTLSTKSNKEWVFSQGTFVERF
jgi:hypothetical protein